MMARRQSMELTGLTGNLSPENISEHIIRSAHDDEFHLPDDPDVLDELHKEKLRQMDVIADEFQLLNGRANELINTKVNELLQKIIDVLNETDLDYRTQVTSLEEQCQRRIDSAEARLTFRLKSIRELGRANELLELLQVEHAKARARQEVLCNIYVELEKTLSERMLNKLSELRRAQRRTFKCRMPCNDADTGEDSDSVTDSADNTTPRATKKPLTLSCPYIVYNLQPHEIEEDLRAIQQTFLCQPSISTIDLYPETDRLLQNDCKDMEEVSEPECD